MAVWYHYIRERNLRDCAEDRVIKGRTSFILPRNFSDAPPEDARKPAIWGFHCPETAYCEHNQDKTDPEDLVQQIRKDIACGETLYLLEITAEETDELYVCDLSVFKDLRNQKFPEGVGWNSEEGWALRKAFEERAKPVYVEYWNSLVPFDEYQPGQYEEPEVVCFTPIPFDRITCARKTDEFVPPPPDPKLLKKLFDL